jgi:copper resistance protein B
MKSIVALMLTGSLAALPGHAIAQDHSMHDMPGMQMPTKPKPKPAPAPAPAKPQATGPAPQVVQAENVTSAAFAGSPKTGPGDTQATSILSGSDAHNGIDHGSMAGMQTKGPSSSPTATGQDGSEPVGTDQSPGSAEPPPPPRDHFADRFFPRNEMARSHEEMMRESGGSSFGLVALNLFEYQAHAGSDGYRWDGEGWYGGDINRLWIKSEGEGELGRSLNTGEIQALYSRAIDPYFNLQGGVRQDFGRGAKRTYATVSLQGLAPGMFEVDGSLFLSIKGELLGRVEGYVDQRITQRLILQPRIELNFAAQDIPESDIGAGLVDGEVGARLRYEISRQFGPYVGVSYLRKTGATARLSRAAGEDVHATSFVAGIRFWF